MKTIHPIKILHGHTTGAADEIIDTGKDDNALAYDTQAHVAIVGSNNSLG